MIKVETQISPFVAWRLEWVSFRNMDDNVRYVTAICKWRIMFLSHVTAVLIKVGVGKKPLAVLLEGIIVQASDHLVFLFRSHEKMCA